MYDEHFLCCLEKPEYRFNDDSKGEYKFTGEKGHEFGLPFSFSCNPPLDPDSKHHLCKVDSQECNGEIQMDRSDQWKGKICFSKLNDKDSGEYVVSSANQVGKGFNNFFLDITSEFDCVVHS